MEMLRTTVALLLLGIAGCPLQPVSGQTNAPVPDVCEVVANIEHYTGKVIFVRGAYVHHVHGSYLRAYPACKGIEAPQIRVHPSPEVVKAWASTGALHGDLVLCTLRGTFGNKSSDLIFQAISMSDVRKVERPR